MFWEYFWLKISHFIREELFLRGRENYISLLWQKYSIISLKRKFSKSNSASGLLVAELYFLELNLHFSIK